CQPSIGWRHLPGAFRGGCSFCRLRRPFRLRRGRFISEVELLGRGGLSAIGQDEVSRTASRLRPLLFSTGVGINNAISAKQKPVSQISVAERLAPEFDRNSRLRLTRCARWSERVNGVRAVPSFRVNIG